MSLEVSDKPTLSGSPLGGRLRPFLVVKAFKVLAADEADAIDGVNHDEYYEESVMDVEQLDES